MNFGNAIFEGIVGAIISAFITYILIYFKNKNKLSKYIGKYKSTNSDCEITITRFEGNTMKIYGTALHKKNQPYETVEFESFIVLEFGGGTAVGNYRWKQLTWDDRIHDQGILRIFFIDNLKIELIFTNISWRPNSDKNLYYSEELQKVK